MGIAQHILKATRSRNDYHPDGFFLSVIHLCRILGSICIIGSDSQ